jgi:hypothetical protein
MRGRVSKTTVESSAAARDAGARYQAAASLGSLENPSFAAVNDSRLGEASINSRGAMRSERSMAGTPASETTTVPRPRTRWLQRVYEDGIQAL